MRPAIRALFFLSGAISLLYEVIWAKGLALTLGSTAVAQSLVLASFLGGLALGSWRLGRLADRARSPLRLYAGLEFAIGILGACSPWLLSLLERLPGAAAQAAGAVLLVAPAAALMGGTLPALTRLSAGAGEEPGRAAAFLYFLNSAGAVAGTLAAGFFLLPALGSDASLRLAAAGNLAVAGAALALARGRSPAPTPRRAAGAPGARPGLVSAVVLVSGFASMAYEVGWVRLLSLILGSSAYSFSLMLAAFIAGIALGGLAASGELPGPLERGGPLSALALAELACAAAVLACLPLCGRLPFWGLRLRLLVPRTPAAFSAYSAAQFAFAFLLMLPGTFLLGTTLPLAARALLKDRETAGADVGAVFAWNTAGNVLGALAAGLWLLPALGVRRLMQAGALLNLLAGLAALVPLLPRARLAALAAGLAASWSAIALLLPPWQESLLASGPFREALKFEGLPRFGFDAVRRAAAKVSVLFYRDDREVTVCVLGFDGARWLKVNGKTDASSHKDMPTQVLQAHIPLLLRPASKAQLTIGLGSGIGAGASLAHPIRRLDVVELSAGVAQAARLFAPQNRDALSDPRLRLSIDDGRSFLRRCRDSYDVILSVPSNPWIAGVASLFSEEFYRSALERLSPDGLMAQWFQLYEMDDETLRMILRTFAAVFPEVTVWQTEPLDILLIGSRRALKPDFPALERALAAGPVKDSLARIGISHASTLLALQTARDEDVRRLAGPGALNRDRLPLLEYAAPKAFFLGRDAELLQREDARMGPRSGLALERYLAARGRPLDRAELRELARFLPFGIPYERSVLREWRTRYPGDREARLRTARELARSGDAAAARAELAPLLRAEAPEAEALELASELAADEGERLALLHRLVRAPGADAASAWAGIAAILKERDWRESARCLDRAARALERRPGAREPDELWMEAALLAVGNYDLPLSLAYGRLALAYNPANAAARDMLRKLELLRDTDKL